MELIDQLLHDAPAMQKAARGRQSLALRRAVRSQLSEILESIEHALAGGQAAKVAGILVGYHRHLRDVGQERRVKDWVARLLSVDKLPEDLDLQFFLHELQYVFDFFSGDTERASHHVEELFRISEIAGSDDYFARSYTAICRLDLRKEDAQAVEEHAERLMNHADKAEDDFHRAFSHHMLANLREMEGNTHEAVAQYTESSRLFEQSGADFMLSVESFNLAACALDMDELEKARNSFATVIGLSFELEDTHLYPELLSCLGLLLMKEEDIEKAARLFGASDAALKEQQRVLYPAEEKIAREARATLLAELGDSAFASFGAAGEKLGPAEAFFMAGFNVEPQAGAA